MWIFFSLRFRRSFLSKSPFWVVCHIMKLAYVIPGSESASQLQLLNLKGLQ